jgi:hypothetical protein
MYIVLLPPGGTPWNENRFCFSEEGFSMAREQIVVDESNIPAGVVGCDDTVPKSKSATFLVVLMFQRTKTNIAILAEKCSAKFAKFMMVYTTCFMQ